VISTKASKFLPRSLKVTQKKSKQNFAEKSKTTVIAEFIHGVPLMLTA